LGSCWGKGEGELIVVSADKGGKDRKVVTVAIRECRFLPLSSLTRKRALKKVGRTSDAAYQEREEKKKAAKKCALHEIKGITIPKMAVGREKGGKNLRRKKDRKNKERPVLTLFLSIVSSQI